MTVKSFAGSYWHTHETTNTYTDGPNHFAVITTYADHCLDDPRHTTNPRVTYRQKTNVKLDAPNLTAESYDALLAWLIAGIWTNPVPKLEWRAP